MNIYVYLTISLFLAHSFTGYTQKMAVSMPNICTIYGFKDTINISSKITNDVNKCMDSLSKLLDFDYYPAGAKVNTKVNFYLKIDFSYKTEPFFGPNKLIHVLGIALYSSYNDEKYTGFEKLYENPSEILDAHKRFYYFWDQLSFMMPCNIFNIKETLTIKDTLIAKKTIIFQICELKNNETKISKKDKKLYQKDKIKIEQICNNIFLQNTQILYDLKNKLYNAYYLALYNKPIDKHKYILNDVTGEDTRILLAITPKGNKYFLDFTFLSNDPLMDNGFSKVINKFEIDINNFRNNDYTELIIYCDSMISQYLSMNYK